MTLFTIRVYAGDVLMYEVGGIFPKSLQQQLMTIKQGCMQRTLPPSTSPHAGMVATSMRIMDDTGTVRAQLAMNA